MSREFLDGGAPGQGGHDATGTGDRGVDVEELRDLPGDELDAGPPSRRPVLTRGRGAAAVAVLALAAGWLATGGAGPTPPAQAGGGPMPTSPAGTGWFAGSGLGSTLTLSLDQAPAHPRYIGDFPPMPARPVTVYRLTAAQGSSAPADVTRLSLASLANLPSSANLFTTTDPATGLGSYVVENPPPHAMSDGGLPRVPVAEATALARRILGAVGADPAQWQVTAEERFGDGWAVDLTLELPGAASSLTSADAAWLPHGRLTVTTTADTPGADPHRLAVQTLDLTSGYRAVEGSVGVRPPDVTFAAVAAGQLRQEEGVGSPLLVQLYDRATPGLMLVPAPDADSSGGGGDPRAGRLLVPAWCFTPASTGSGSPPTLVVEAVDPGTRLAGAAVGVPYAVTP